MVGCSLNQNVIHGWICLNLLTSQLLPYFSSSYLLVSLLGQDLLITWVLVCKLNYKIAFYQTLLIALFFLTYVFLNFLENTKL